VSLSRGAARQDRLLGQVSRRLREELAKLEVAINDEKSTQKVAVPGGYRDHLDDDTVPGPGPGPEAEAETADSGG